MSRVECTGTIRKKLKCIHYFCGYCDLPQEQERNCNLKTKTPIVPTWLIEDMVKAKKIVADAEHEEEAKADKGKLRISLVPMQIIKDIAKVRMYGTEKYKDPQNWRKVEVERYIDALLRHMLEFIKDRYSKDEESGIEHYKHMACNMAFICEMMNEYGVG